MKRIIMLLASGALVSVTGASLAQDDEDASNMFTAPEMYTYGTYWTCDGGSLSVADELIASGAERMNGLVDDGTLAGWAWLGHHTGGPWSRLFVHRANSLDALLDGLDALQSGGGEDSEDGEADTDDGPTLNTVCTRHEDYIWQVENGAGGAGSGEVSFVMYLNCDSSREERADEIVAEHVAPILNAMVEDGSLTGWGWLSHVVGGKYRRLQSMAGSDHKSVLAARDAAIEAIYADDNEMGAELNDICGSHADYMWDIIHQH